MKSELPEILKRVTDSNDILKGNLGYVNCSLSDDGAKIEIAPNKNYAEVKVTSGKLSGSLFSITLKRMPVVPKDLKAKVGDTLAKVILPEGFTWKDASLSVGPEGTKTFKAAYTPVDTDTYVYVDDIDVPVTVEAADDEQPTKPTDDEQVTKPADDEETTRPSDDQQPTEPTDDEEPTKPSSDEQATEPADDEEPTKPSSDEQPTEPSDDEEPTESSDDEEPTEPSDDEQATEPSGDGQPTKPTVDEQSTKNDTNKNETEGAADAASSVNTFDAAPIIPVTVILLVSGMILYITVFVRKKTM